MKCPEHGIPDCSPLLNGCSKLTELVPYADIPITARNVLDEIYDVEGVEIWWNSTNGLLQHYTRAPGPMIPRCHPDAAEQLANALADGVFF